MNNSDTMKFVYIFDEQRQLEIIAEHRETFNPGVDDGSIQSMYSGSTKHEILPIRIAPLGQMLAEFISIDVNKLKQQIDLSTDQAPKIPELFSFITVRDNDAWVYALNCIESTREFIDLCVLNPDVKSSVRVNALVDTIGAPDFLNEYECTIETLDLLDGYTWEEKFDYTRFDRGDESMGDFDLWALDFDASRLKFFLPKYISHHIAEQDRLTKCSHAWSIDYLVGFLVMSLENCLAKSIKISKCKNCGLYFIAQNRSDTLYCDRPSPQDVSKTCKEYGARQAWEKTLKENEAAGLYRKIYMSKQMLAKRNPDIPLHQRAFENFKAQAKLWKSDVKSGAKTETEYIKWLKAVKEKKVLNNGKHKAD